MSNSALRISFRVDASTNIGSGHVMRCLTLADALRTDGAESSFLCRHLPPSLARQIEKSGHHLHRLVAPARKSPTDAAAPYAEWLGTSCDADAEETTLVLEKSKPDWLVVDHYALDAHWERAIRSRARHVLVVDDLANRDHDCDILLDPNLHADPRARYSGRVPAETRLLLGPHYALLRKEFADMRKNRKPDYNRATRILAFLGGMDPGNETGKAIEAFLALNRNDIRLDVITGEDNPHSAVLMARFGDRSNIAVHAGVPDMAKRLGECDIAIGAGGVAMWERCCIGLPTVTVAVAENQQPGAESLARHGGTLYLGPSSRVNAADLRDALAVLLRSVSLRQSISERATALVDGAGTMRVAGMLLGSELALRPARSEDADDVLVWRNDAVTRRHSGNEAEIPAKDHARWFAATLASADRRLLIAEESGRPVGVLRYDVGDAEAVVSIYLVPGNYGRGLGARLLEAGDAWIAQRHPGVRCIIAHVREDNARSRRAFEAAGYSKHTIIFRKELRR